MKKGGVIILGIIAVMILGYIGYKNYQLKWKPNVSEDGLVYIAADDNYEMVLTKIKRRVDNYETFLQLADEKDFKNNFKRGKYQLIHGENNSDIINRIIEGNQVEQTIKIGDFDNLETMSQKMAEKFEYDSLTIIEAIKDFGTRKNVYDLEALKIYFLPNTYTFYWNTPVEEVIEKMTSEHSQFWNQERLNKAKAMGLTPLEVTTLASIVQKESSKKDEQPTIAGLYYNRLMKGMKLQSDPTVIYAMKKRDGFNIVIKRVYNKYLYTDSPYNTYKYEGLPPSPICLTQPETIDAVLNYKKHHYIYMCAKPNSSGYHDFSENYEQHEIYAKKYAEWLNKINVN